ncbi:hypothetical protein KC333_g909 [Hortaea werneckii]|nr:hypothetical protein KC333_g909 [Hortaea werneckii]KAI7325473.1 hypothetical protein KC326_g646 [Hortaea werneckii]
MLTGAILRNCEGTSFARDKEQSSALQQEDTDPVLGSLAVWLSASRCGVYARLGEYFELCSANTIQLGLRAGKGQTNHCFKDTELARARPTTVSKTPSRRGPGEHCFDDPELGSARYGPSTWKAPARVRLVSASLHPRCRDPEDGGIIETVISLTVPSADINLDEIRAAKLEAFAEPDHDVKHANMRRKDSSEIETETARVIGWTGSEDPWPPGQDIFEVIASSLIPDEIPASEDAAPRLIVPQSSELMQPSGGHRNSNM